MESGLIEIYRGGGRRSSKVGVPECAAFAIREIDSFSTRMYEDRSPSRAR